MAVYRKSLDEEPDATEHYLHGEAEAVQLGQVIDVVPLRDGTVLAEDCEGAGATGLCTLTGYAATGALLWKRSVPGQLDLIRDTPYGLLVRTDQGAGGVIRLDDPRSGVVLRAIGRSYAVIYSSKPVAGSSGRFYFMGAGDRFDMKTRKATRQGNEWRPLQGVKPPQ